MKKNLGKKGIAVCIVLLFLCVYLVSGIEKNISDIDKQTIIPLTKANQIEKTVPITLSFYGKTGIKKQTIVVSLDDATKISRLFNEMKSSMTTNPSSGKTQQLQNQFFALLKEIKVVPTEISKEAYLSLLNPRWVERLQNREKRMPFPQPFTNRGTCVFCSLGGDGEGILIPLFLLPRPRIAMLWLGTGLNTAANLLTGKGYVAGGAQTGFAFGFMGIGLSYALPGYTLYGFIGYALLASTTAEYVEHYPPNRAPEISDVNPADKQQNVPLSLTELQFRIQDADGNLMSYTVTSEPNIGFASGNLKPFGVYKVPVSGLVDLTNYTWHIQVTDGKDTTEETMTFTTEAIAPIISNPIPADGERDVPMDIPSLQFTLKDYQGDTMEYTVQTSPNIGSDHKVGVHDGTYTVPVSGLTYGATYHWYVNVTDGTHWTRKIFSFETGYPSQFDPFNFGWQYRKPITIDHTQVLDDLTNFPVLVSTSDTDLSQKAQVDGDDILFMNNAGVSTRVYHDLESYDASSGTLITWVNIPSLSSSNDTVFYMYYGNPSCIDQAYPEKTWDSNYKAVWHMNDATPSTISDSTSNHYTGTKLFSDEPMEKNGKIGKNQDFDGTNDYIQFTNPIIPIGTKTISTWFKCYNPNNWGVVLTSAVGISSSDSGTVWECTDSGDKMTCYMGNGATSGHFMRVFPTIPDTTSWHYYTMTYDGATLCVYRDGVLAVSTTTKSGSETNPTYDLRLGRSNHASLAYPLDGELDEVRIADSPLSAAWIDTEYTNQNYPAEFIFVGAEEPGP